MRSAPLPPRAPRLTRRSIIANIVSRIDLNTLDALARTSRAVHDGLMQYRRILLASTLRCSNEKRPVDRDELLRCRARATNWHYMEDGRGYSGKSGDCARDMVGECRRCGTVVCRVSLTRVSVPSRRPCMLASPSTA